MKNNKILVGNAIDIAKTLDKESVSMVMTSPPYWGLRDYKTDQVIWDTHGECDHEWETQTVKGISGGKESSKVKIKGEENFQEVADSYFYQCKKCHASKCELGREPTPQLYIKHLCDIFDAIKPAIAEWGSLYVNLGDTYYGGGQGGGSGLHKKDRDYVHVPNARNSAFPSKSLVGIPFMFALEMISRGWLLRNTIIWHKPNPMPTSARDRFTVDFEYIFFFTKRKDYYYRQYLEPAEEQNPLQGGKYGGNKYPDSGTSSGIYSGKEYEAFVVDGVVYRNKRTTWTINPSQFKGKHFAVYPEELCDIPIYCSCPDRICTKCGKPVEYERISINVPTRSDSDSTKSGQSEYAVSGERNITIDTGFREKYCDCKSTFKPGVVLDPFFGRGTTGLVALRQGKEFIGIDVKQEHKELADEFIRLTFPQYDEDDDIDEI